MNTFCVLPWFSQENYKNYQTPCCLLQDPYNIDDVKKDLLNGRQNIACQKCWNLESQGIKSRRQQENEFLDYKLERDLEKIQKDCKEGRHRVLLYQISTSNLCNQACVSCSSMASTKWAEIEKRQRKSPNKLWVMDIDSQTIDFANARRISLLGGEPLYDAKTFDILKKLIKHKNQDCFVTFVTNGSVDINDAQKEVLSQFSDLNVCVSIDGIDKRFEYMRWPGKWSRLEHNLHILRKLSKSLSVSYTISSLNALYYNETTAWFRSEGLDFNHNIVSHPDWLSLENSPKKLLDEFSDIPFFQRYNENHRFCDLETFKEKIRSQDVAKKINLRDYMPEVADIIGYN